MRAGRAAAGFSLTTVPVVIALSPGGPAVMEPVLFVVAGLIVLGTLAPVLPLLHRLPEIGAPTVKLRVTIGNQEDLVVSDPSMSVVLRVGIFNGGRAELERARLNVLVPVTVWMTPVDTYWNQFEWKRGTRMPRTSEQLLPGVDSDWWFERHDFDPNWTIVHYRLKFPEQGNYPVRIKLDSKSMYRGIEEDYEIRVHGPEG